MKTKTIFIATILSALTVAAGPGDVGSVGDNNDTIAIQMLCKQLEGQLSEDECSPKLVDVNVYIASGVGKVKTYIGRLKFNAAKNGIFIDAIAPNNEKELNNEEDPNKIVSGFLLTEKNNREFFAAHPSSLRRLVSRYLVDKNLNVSDSFVDANMKLMQNTFQAKYGASVRIPLGYSKHPNLELGEEHPITYSAGGTSIYFFRRSQNQN